MPPKAARPAARPAARSAAARPTALTVRCVQPTLAGDRLRVAAELEVHAVRMQAVVVGTHGEVVDAAPLQRVGVQLACEGMAHGEVHMVRWIDRREGDGATMGGAGYGWRGLGAAHRSMPAWAPGRA